MENAALEFLQLASNTPKNAVFFGQNHGNLIAIHSNFDYEVIDPSGFGESVNEEEIKAFQKQERESSSFNIRYLKRIIKNIRQKTCISNQPGVF